MAIQLAGKHWDYILEDDRDSESPTIFVIDEWNAAQRMMLIGLYPSTGEAPGDDANEETVMAYFKQLDDADMTVCEMGISLVRGVLDAEGQPHDMPANQVLPKLKKQSHIRELAQACLEKNRLTEDERKN